MRSCENLRIRKTCELSFEIHNKFCDMIFHTFMLSWLFHLAHVQLSNSIQFSTVMLHIMSNCPSSSWPFPNKAAIRKFQYSYDISSQKIGQHIPITLNPQPATQFTWSMLVHITMVQKKRLVSCNSMLTWWQWTGRLQRFPSCYAYVPCHCK